MKYLKAILIVVSLILIGYISWNAYKPKYYAVAPKAIMAEVSPTNGIKVVIDEDTDWTPVFQVLVILLGTYGGIKLINKYTK